MNRQQNPIGIFDSGIGGLTVARAIKQTLPDETLCYFGDTAHVPYGDKSPELIRHYALRITDFLVHEKKCKALVIACNTASAAAYEELRDKYKGSIPVINVIDPMIETVIADESIQHVGVIATKATIASGIYQEKFSRRKPLLKFSALATPLLASMIEEGFFNDRISQEVLSEYLGHAALAGIDALVLACTHYPLIKDEIDTYFHHRVKVLDSAGVVAEKLKTILIKENLIAQGRGEPNAFFVSDYTASFEQSAEIFLGEKINLVEVKI